MISGDSLCSGEPGEVGLGFDNLFGRIAHLAQPRGLLLGRAQYHVVRLYLPDIEAQGQIDQPREWRRCGESERTVYTMFTSVTPPRRFRWCP